MDTKNIRLTNRNYSQVVKRVALLVKRGKIAIIGYDTVYGYIANYQNDKALRKIFLLKERPLDKTIGLAVANFNVLKDISILSKRSENFIKKKIPGKYTFIVKRNPKFQISKYLRKENSIGVRIPASQFVLDVTRRVGGIVAQTSANKSKHSNCFNIQELLEQYNF